MVLGSGENMLNGDTKPAADRVDAALESPAQAGLPPAVQPRRTTPHGDRNDATRPSRFVTGARAILLLSLACWAALLGVGMLLFG